jgi:hypothetical protein
LNPPSLLIEFSFNFVKSLKKVYFFFITRKQEITNKLTIQHIKHKSHSLHSTIIKLLIVAGWQLANEGYLPTNTINLNNETRD